MQFIQYFSPDTLNSIVGDLLDVRFHTRDEACEALEVCKQCARLGGDVPTLIVMPSTGPKHGFFLIQPNSEDMPTDEEDEPSNHTATGDSSDGVSQPSSQAGESET